MQTVKIAIIAEKKHNVENVFFCNVATFKSHMNHQQKHPIVKINHQ